VFGSQASVLVFPRLVLKLTNSPTRVEMVEE